VRSSPEDIVSNLVKRSKSKLRSTDFVCKEIWTNGKGKTSYYEADEFLIIKNMEIYIFGMYSERKRF